MAILAGFVLGLASPSQADEAGLRSLIGQFSTGSGFSDTEKTIDDIAGYSDEAAVPLLRALADGTLMILRTDRTVVIAKEMASGFVLNDPLSLEKIGEGVAADLDKIKIKNSLRRKITDAIASMTLSAPRPKVRLKAANDILNRPDVALLEAVEIALSVEKDSAVSSALSAAKAAIILDSDRDEAEKLDAIKTLASKGGRDVATLLSRYQATTNSVTLQAAAQEAMVQINETLAMWQVGQNIWYGLSLGSVLLLAAIGLAITFGVMGIINMAHGEMVMLGAYTTYAVQEVIRNSAPGLFEYSLLIALPSAFLVSGAVGLAMERGIIRYLYGRPLETLLATWGVSLILQQTVRTLFGPSNKEVGNPQWMSGAFQVGEMLITYNRLWIMVFCLLVFALLLFILKRSSFGLQMRAVTQNRPMASSMGIRTPWVDAFTFALGSGVAGIAGVALSQIDNVSPNLGQSYIIDSFMVVVFGGVGNLWGAFVGAFTLGIANKFLEPYAGAVLAKILILVAIILFIQKRPRGLFALKGRSVEA